MNVNFVIILPTLKKLTFHQEILITYKIVYLRDKERALLKKKAVLKR